MCDPVTAGLALSGAGMGVSAMSQYGAGQYNSDVAKHNADLAEMDATLSLAKGVQQENQSRRDVEQLKGRQVVTTAANNLEMSGTPLDILTDTALIGEMDALTIRNNARMEAFGYKMEADSSRAKADLAKSQGTFGAASSLLGGAGNLLGQL